MMRAVAFLLLLAVGALAADTAIVHEAKNADPEGKVGERPYEMAWAKRAPAHPELVTFEDLGGWTAVGFAGCQARLFRSREEQMFGTYTAKAVYTGRSAASAFELRPPEPMPIPGEPHAVQLWVRGNNWGWHPTPKTARTRVRVVVQDAQGERFEIDLGQVNFDYWFLMHAAFVSPAGERTRIRVAQPPSAVSSRGNGTLDYPLKFLAIRVGGCSDPEPAKLFFDSLQFYTPEYEPLAEPKLPPKDVPWPTTPDTITPIPKEKLANAVRKEGETYVFEARAKRDTIRWLYTPKLGNLSDLSVEINDQRFQPCAGGGPVFLLAGEECRPTDDEVTMELKAAEIKGDQVNSYWHVRRRDDATNVRYILRAKDKSLQITCAETPPPEPVGHCTAFRIGRAVFPRVAQPPSTESSEGHNPAQAHLFRVPYLTLGNGPHLVHWNGIFLSALLDWYNSDGSTLDVQHGSPAPDEVIYNGGSRYLPKTDGTRNPLRERLIVTVATDVHEVFPHIPHPKSDTAHLARKAIWRNIGSPNRGLLKRLKARGVENFICPLHEVGWRDAGESFTFRLRAAPRIGDQKMKEYGQWVKSLGYRFGLYANYTDFAPVNGNWSPDRVCRQPDGNWTRAWPRCYAPKPTYAWQAEAHYAPRIAETFGANTCYSDVHTAVFPWGRTDYDHRVPGAGMFRTTWAAYAHLLWNESKAYRGPVFSEGSCQWLYAGISDGNYGQLPRAGRSRWRRPPLVDFDLLKMHPLMTDFGMGAPNMFYDRHDPSWRTPRERTNPYLDRFITSTLAFGHIGYLPLDWGFEGALKCYYMTNAVQQHYALVPVEAIRYFDGEKLVDTSTAIRTGAYKRGQVYVKYESGLELWCNLSHEHDWQVAAGRLPPGGHYAENRTPGEKPFFQFSGIERGKHFDVVRSDQDLYLDTRGEFLVYGGFAGRGAAAFKPADEGGWRLFPAETCHDPTVRVHGTEVVATAYDIEGQPLRDAEVRLSNLGATVLPVKGAYSYDLRRTEDRPTPPPDEQVRRLVNGPEYTINDTARGFAGKDIAVESVRVERVTDDGKGHDKQAFAGLDEPITVRVPAHAAPDTRLWWRLHIKGKTGEEEVERVGWFTGLAARAIDVDVKPASNGPQKPGSVQELKVQMTSNLPHPADVTVDVERNGPKLVHEPFEVSLTPGKTATYLLAYRIPTEPILVPVTFSFRFPLGRQTVRRWFRATEAQATVVDIAKRTPANTGLAVRGKAEQPLDTARTGAQFAPSRRVVGGVSKEGLFCHPPYKGGVGYAFGTFRVSLPDAPCAFESYIGFADGSTTQDGCVFSVQVKALDVAQPPSAVHGTGPKKTQPGAAVPHGTGPGAEQGFVTVEQVQYARLKAWGRLRADLAAFRGRTVLLRLVTDVGPNDNSSSDWACWGEPRIVYAGTWLLPQVLDEPKPLPIGPPPKRLDGLRPADLEGVAEAAIVLDTAGVNHGEHTSYVYLNGVKAGITPASKSDTAWTEGQEVPVPPAARKTLGPRNAVVIKNPGQDCFKVRRLHLRFKLADGRTGTSKVANGPFCSDEGWLHAEGQGVPRGHDLPEMPCDIPTEKERS
jgi:hypothetical protein